MTLLRRRHAVLWAVLAATLLTGLAVPTADASLPRATRYHVGGPINLDTNLLSASGATAWAIDEYLASNTSLPPLGAAFMGAERKYRVNAKFLLAAAMHESAWGTGYIARVKHNLFGYNAYDRSPFDLANAYASFAAGIDATAKFMKTAYLTRTGRWWGGQPTLRSMQQYWSSSGGWGASVSRIANSIHFDAFSGRALAMRTPVVRGLLHGGDAAAVQFTWGGRPLPAGITFVATWTPVQLDADVLAAAALPRPSTGNAGVPGASIGVAGAPGATGDAVQTPAAKASPPQHPSSTVAAKRTAIRSHSASLVVRAPAQPGTYQLAISLRDTDGKPLPAAEQAVSPTAIVRVWGVRAIGVNVSSSTDGTGGALVTITNTGRKTIPATPTAVAPSAVPEPQITSSIVTVTASSVDPSNPALVLLLAAPLAADLRPGASATFQLPAIAAATGRTTNLLSVSLSVLGDASWLAPSSPAVTWFSTESASVSPFGAAAAGLQFDGSSPSPPLISPSASPTPTGSLPAPTGALPAPTPTPAPSATPQTPPTPVPTGALPAPTPVPTARPMTPPRRPAPSPTASPDAPPPSPSNAPAPPPRRKPSAHKPVTLSFSEHSRAVAYRGSWGNAANAGYFGGNVAWSKSPGSTATLMFSGSSVSWIGPMGPTRGAALVRLDGRIVARVDLWRPAFVARAVLFHRSFASGRHTLTIVVLSTPSRPCVAIDGFVVRS